MKKLLLSLTMVSMVVAIGAPVTSQSASGEVTTAGKEFVELLAKEDFAGAVGQFDDTMRTALPEPKLRETWQTLQAQAGPFQKQLGIRATKSAGYDVVLVTCQFKQEALDVKVVFNDKRRVAGLFFVPSHPAANSSEPPSYARTNAFREKEFTVGSGEWRLPGTLTLPTTGGPWPAVVLVHGSGPNDRDETVGANKPFRDLAWGLATKGIAVLRYEKRTKEYADKFKTDGVGHITVQEETIDDALSAAAQLRATDGLDPKRIFIAGHSLGGMVAPRIGQADPKLAGLIILAGATRPLEDLMAEQTRYLISLHGKPSGEDQVKFDQLLVETAKVKRLTAADASSPALLLHAPAAYWLDLREHDTLAIAKGLKQPLLILQGGRDYQVTEVDFNRWKEALGARPNVTFKLYPKLNHLFMAGEGKSTPDEYEEPGHVAEGVVADMAEWIGAR
jgi:dienelactone hydrolase